MMVNNLLLWLLSAAISGRYLVFAATCRSYSQRCVTVLGQPVTNPAATATNTSYDFALETAVRDSIYLVYEVTAPMQGLVVSTSLFYGTVDIYVQRNLEPSPSDFFLSSSSGLLTIPMTESITGDLLNVLIKASTVAKLQVLLSSTATSSSVVLTNGVPITYSIASSGATQSFRYTPHGSFSIAVVPFTAAAPSITAKSSVPGTVIRTETAIGNTLLAVSPSTAEIAKEFTIEIGSVNGSSLGLQSAAYSFQITILEPAHTDAGSGVAAVNALRMLGAFGAYDTSLLPMERYYIFETQLSSSNTILSFILESLTGNADLYINPSSQGYYKYSDTATASWSSASDAFVERLNIVATGSDSASYLITVRCRAECAYTLRGSSHFGMTTVFEGSAVQLSVPFEFYRYFQFFDNLAGTADLVFSLRGVVGDPDLYISCQLDPTYDHDGYPSSRYDHHMVYSSSSYSADVIDIPSTSEHCSGNVYYVGIYGYGYGAENVEFILSAKHRAATTTLVPGTPFEDSLPRGTLS